LYTRKDPSLAEMGLGNIYPQDILCLCHPCSERKGR
jgi:hypothetical protein